MLSTARMRLSENLAAVEARIAAACGRAGRPRSAVALVAVTKYTNPEVAAALHELGVKCLGESRPQQLWERTSAMPTSIDWHLIGHLQRNKVERTLPLVRLIHSVDSVRLLDAISAAGVKQDRTADVLLEVHLSGEAAKSGFAVEELADLQPRLPRVRIAGLMTMAALQNPQECRPTFAALRALRDRLASNWGVELPELSMGMSNDFEVAIEEGATLIRVGSCLMEGLDQ